MSSLLSNNNNNNINLVVVYFIRVHFEKKFNTNVATAIKNVILYYSQRCIGSKLLCQDEDFALFKMLNKYISCIKSFKLLYRGSENKFSAVSFHEKCSGLDKFGQIVIIQSNHNSIFGGYTSKDWSRDCTLTKEQDDCCMSQDWSRDCAFTKDDCAFLYLVKSDNKEFNRQCPMYFPIKSNKKNVAIAHNSNCGPIFGLRDIYISDKCNEKKLIFDDDEGDLYFSQNYCCFEAYDDNGQSIVICGGKENWDGYYDYEEEEWNAYGLDGIFDVVDFEVFKVIK